MLKSFFTLLACAALPIPCAWATYSIVACETRTRACGVAVQTNNLAVGASVPYAQAGVGAIASQFETNPGYGPRGLALLAAGKSPEEVLRQLLREDGDFGGEGIEARQVGVAGVDGRSAFYTGSKAASADWAGARRGNGFSVQGNGLAGPRVLDAMERAFLANTGPLADRLLAALAAGDAAGGQKTGRESAALLVRTPDGFPLDIDLRVDHSSDPVTDLRGLYSMQAARQQVIGAGIAARRGQFDQSRSMLISGVALAPTWPRVWIRAAQIAIRIEEPQLALQYLMVAFSQNPAWAPEEIGEGNYAELGMNPMFHRWVSAERAKEPLLAYRMRGAATREERIRLARRLLEAGHSREGAEVLGELPRQSNESVDLTLLRATAFAAYGDSPDAIGQCKAALEKFPNDLRVRMRLTQLEALPGAGSGR